ncbi:MAG: translocation/assembly module TamB domain-containing protein, partial [Cyanobacterium sp. T60_A2020_053]|nr:translocation/assembly module TamB domain-containing protein [Cyanobacterium sp. T60_A2020_053]
KADELTENQTNLSLAREGNELLSDNQNISIDKEKENLSSLPVTSKADELTENQTNLSLAREGNELLSDNIKTVKTENKETPQYRYKLKNNQKENTDSQNQSKPLFRINNKNLPLQEAIEEWEKIKKIADETEKQKNNANIPPLESLEGKFDGKINLSASRRSGISLDFDFNGNQWQWGKYQADSLQVKGNYDNGLLTLLPVSIKFANSILSLTGTFGSERISGQLLLSDLPVEMLGEMFSLPENLDIKGIVNANLVISGNEVNPLARGSIDLVNATINDNKIEETQASLGYSNSRLEFLASSNLIGEEESARVTGSIPFQLLPQSSPPVKENFDLTFNINQSGFGLLKVVTNNQFDLTKGEGEVNLTIQGNYSQNNNQVTDVITDGVANINEGEMKVSFIPDTPITNINGQVLFDFDQVTIPQLTGNFNDGDIIINGSLSLFEDNLSNNILPEDRQQELEENLPNNGLNVSIDNLSLDLPNLYQGSLGGNVNIGGRALNPSLSGKISLSNGNIPLGNSDNSQSDNPFQSNDFIANTAINQLQVILADNVSISQPPVLNLQARGALTLNGSVGNLQPEGVINLVGGSVNLFTSQFKLARNYPHSARFTPENGFNAFLDMRLETAVTETSRYRFTNNSNPNEIRDDLNSTINTIETVRINAQIKGLASNDINNNLELSSSPARNRTEIISLLGGGFNTNSGQENGVLTLANIASSAVLGSFQNNINSSFNFLDFRLFPIQITNSESRVSNLALGGEISADITDKISASFLAILTEQEAPLYSIRYRLNDQLLLRGSTNFNDDSRGALEFQLRF